MEKTIKAVGYICEIPVKGTDECISKDDQRARILKHAEKEGIEVVCIYEDEKYTADFMSRPGIQQLLNLKEEFDIILVERVWCLSRKMKSLKPFFEKLDSRKAELKCSSCLWDFVSQQVRHRYGEDVGAKMRKAAKAKAAGRSDKQAA